MYSVFSSALYPFLLLPDALLDNPAYPTVVSQ